MLINQTIDKLHDMGLDAMASGLREQMEQSQYHELSFEERLGLLVDREATWRENRRQATRLKAAKLRHQATVEDVEFRAPRGLDRGVVLSLAQGEWIANRHNLLITGGYAPMGNGGFGPTTSRAPTGTCGAGCGCRPSAAAGSSR